MDARQQKRLASLCHLLGFPDVPLYSEAEIMLANASLENWRFGFTFKKSQTQRPLLSDVQKNKRETLVLLSKHARIFQELAIISIVLDKFPGVYLGLKPVLFVPELDVWNVATSSWSPQFKAKLQKFQNPQASSLFKMHEQQLTPNTCNIALPFTATFKALGETLFTRLFQITEACMIRAINTNDVIGTTAEVLKLNSVEDRYATQATLDPTNLAQKLVNYLVSMYDMTQFTPKEELAITDYTEKLCALLHRLACNRKFILLRSVTSVDTSDKRDLDLVDTDTTTAFARAARLSVLIEKTIFDVAIKTVFFSSAKFERNVSEDGLENVRNHILFWLANKCPRGFAYFLGAVIQENKTDDRVNSTRAENIKAIAKALETNETEMYRILQTYVYKAFTGDTRVEPMSHRLFLNLKDLPRYASSSHIYI